MRKKKGTNGCCYESVGRGGVILVTVSASSDLFFFRFSFNFRAMIKENIVDLFFSVFFS
ncbi:Uncharacterised protein [Chlamydia trachomatis]|nr:Uncharacterised protein [Chlamydia trachomatis]